MASVCVNHIPTAYSKYAWLSPRISNSSSSDDKPDLESAVFDAGDFEFRLADNLTTLSADELFSDGKLVPLQFFTPKKSPPPSTPPEQDARPPELVKSCPDSLTEDPYLFSPKAPRCSSRWRELLGLRKLQHDNKEVQGQPKTTSSTNGKLIRHFLNRNSKASCCETSLTSPLLKESSSSSSAEYEPISISLSRVSLDELPRHRENPNNEPIRSLSSGPKPQRVRPRDNPNPHPHPHPHPHPRVGRSPMRKNKMSRGVSVDSPRMNPSGRVVFQSLERSSSSPSSFNGGPRYNYNNNNNNIKNRGMIERSYSGNVHVRITPVLNVPVVCSLRGSFKLAGFGFTQFFSSSNTQKKDSHINSRTKHISRINKIHRDGKQTKSGKTVETSIF